MLYWPLQQGTSSAGASSEGSTTEHVFSETSGGATAAGTEPGSSAAPDVFLNIEKEATHLILLS